MTKIKVLQINESLVVGGMESMIVQLCNHLNTNKFDVKFYSLSDNVPKVKEFKDSVTSVSLGFKQKSLRGANLIFNFFKVIRKLSKMFKVEKPDIVHIHGLFSIYLIVAIAVRISCPNAKVVKTIHTSGLFYSSTRLIDRFRLRIEKIATSLNNTTVVGISDQVTDIAKKKFGNNATSIVKIYNGVDISAFEGEPNKLIRSRLLGDKEFLVAYVARVVNGKNHEFLIDIWNELKKRGVTSSRLIFIGAGDNLEYIKHKISSLHLDDDIICLGQCSNVPDILKVCDFAVFPSDYEGFSLAMIEKMAAGLPVIASDIPSFREIIISGKNGIILSLHDKEKWIYTINILSEDSKLRVFLSDSASERSKDFSVELMTKGYETLYIREVYK